MYLKTRKRNMKKIGFLISQRGSALIKTFYYPVDERNPSAGKQLLEQDCY